MLITTESQKKGNWPLEAYVVVAMLPCFPLLQHRCCIASVSVTSDAVGPLEVRAQQESPHCNYQVMKQRSQCNAMRDGINDFPWLPQLNFLFSKAPCA